MRNPSKRKNIASFISAIAVNTLLFGVSNGSDNNTGNNNLIYNKLDIDGAYSCQSEQLKSKEWTGTPGESKSLLFDGNSVVVLINSKNKQPSAKSTNWSFHNSILTINGHESYSLIDLSYQRLFLYPDENQNIRWNCNREGKENKFRLSFYPDKKNWGGDDRLGKTGTEYVYDNPYTGDIEFFTLANLGADNKYWYFPINKTDNSFWEYTGTAGSDHYNDFNIDGKYGCEYQAPTPPDPWLPIDGPAIGMDIKGNSITTDENLPGIAPTPITTEWSYQKMAFNDHQYSEKRRVAISKTGDLIFYMSDKKRNYCYKVN